MDAETSKIASSLANGSQDDKADENGISQVISGSSTGSPNRSPAPVPITKSGRTQSSHSLLAVNDNRDARKGSSQTHTSKTAVDRASISMPPPSMPGADRRLSTSIASITSPRKSEEISTAGSPPSSVKSVPDDRGALAATTSPPTTATDTTSITTSSTPQLPGLPVLSPPAIAPNIPNQPSAVISQAPEKEFQAPARSKTSKDGALPNRGPRAQPARSISAARRFSGSANSDSGDQPSRVTKIGTIGVCALDIKARSRPSRNILNKLNDNGEFEVIIFGDKVITDEAVEHWPICDFLIAFFSDGFPLDKAIEYVKLRKPFVVNDLSMQKVLWDRRLCLRILDAMGVPTPTRIEVNRDGGPRLESPELAEHMKKMNTVQLPGPDDGTGGGAQLTQHVAMADDGDTLLVDGKPFRKPFVEKPVNGDDHNVIIYFPKNVEGGGARRLFRKIGNKSSEYDPDLVLPRCITDLKGSYIYEQFLRTENSEDVKAYTVGPNYCHAETRKSPVVDGVVKRNTHGKELRYITTLSKEEASIASKVAIGFGQRICGFDMLRAGASSFVIDVNGWSFVKDNNEYYEKCAEILKATFTAEKLRQEIALDDNTSDAGGEMTPARRETQGHRSALKQIFKSPSMKSLSSHIPHPHPSHHHNAHRKNSPMVNSATIPLSSPPSMDRQGTGEMSTSPTAFEASPQPPIVTTTNSVTITIPTIDTAPIETTPPMPSSKHSWKLKGMVAVIRHADRTPKQKVKFTAHSQVFADLLKGHQEEVLLKGEAALVKVEEAVKVALEQNLEDPDKLRTLQLALRKKASQPGTKVQIKPMFRKKKPEEMDGNNPRSPKDHSMADNSIPENDELHHSESPTAERHGSIEARRVATRSDSVSDVTFSRFSAAEDNLILDKLQLVMKWGGEPTHSVRYQSQDLGASMRDDLKLLNRSVLDNVRIFTSSEKRVKISAQIWAAAFLGRDTVDEDEIEVRKDLLDDSNAAKDVMDKVKKKLKHLLREGNSAPEQFAWPKGMPEPSIVMGLVVNLLKFHRRVMRHNFKKLGLGAAAASLSAINGSADSRDIPAKSKDEKPLTATSIQSRWCTGEDPELFKERWEKLFSEFCDSEKADPSKVSELYDTMKYDALHNKQFLEWVFTPSQGLLEEIAKEDAAISQTGSPEPEKVDSEPAVGVNRHASINTLSSVGEKHSFAQKIGLRRRSVLAQPPSTPPLLSYEDGSYFKLFSGTGDSKSRNDKRLGRLRELYRYAKILFDFVCPQEYGISDHEKLEIGLLTSLPLLREIVADLEELQAGDAKSFVYFTKESHIYTLLNCIMEGGIHTKIKRSAIPELDYLSQICFELYEAKDEDSGSNTYSIRISISPGCHTVDPLDVSLDSKHAIGSAPRRSLTNHQNWKDVIETFKAKFETVQLPKSFLAVNVSDKHTKDEDDITDGEEVNRGREGASASATEVSATIPEP